MQRDELARARVLEWFRAGGLEVADLNTTGHPAEAIAVAAGERRRQLPGEARRRRRQGSPVHRLARVRARHTGWAERWCAGSDTGGLHTAAIQAGENFNYVQAMRRSLGDLQFWTSTSHRPPATGDCIRRGTSVSTSHHPSQHSLFENKYDNSPTDYREGRSNTREWGLTLASCRY